MADIGSDTCNLLSISCSMVSRGSDERTWATSDIVECEFADTRIELHQQGQRLTDTSASTEDSDLGQLEAQRCQQRSTERGQNNRESEQTCDAEAEKARRCAKPLLKACLAANIVMDYERRIWRRKGSIWNGRWTVVMNFVSGQELWRFRGLVHRPSPSFRHSTNQEELRWLRSTIRRTRS